MISTSGRIDDLIPESPAYSSTSEDKECEEETATPAMTMKPSAGTGSSVTTTTDEDIET